MAASVTAPAWSVTVRLRILRAPRASPSESRAMSRSASGSAVAPVPPSPRSESASARSRMLTTSSSESGWREYTRQRERRAAFTSKDGFSVVAPIRMSVPFSTWGRKASCCPLLKRWISSTKRMVRLPPRARSVSASATTWRISLTPASTAEKGTKRAPATWAMRKATVVLPVPGGPQRIIECRRPSSSARRSTLPGPIRCCWPTTSSRLRGRIRSASGAGGDVPGETGVSNRSTSKVYAGETTPHPALSPQGRGVRLGEGGGEVEERRDAGGDGDAAPLELGGVRAIGDEWDAAGLGRHAVDPGIADNHDVRRLRPALAHDAQSVGIGFEGGDIVTRHHQIQIAEQVEAAEDEVGHHAIIVRPDGGGEAELPEGVEGFRGEGLERRLLHGPPLVGLGNGEDVRLEVRSGGPHVTEDLGARPAKLALRQGQAALAHEGLHLAAHRLEVQRRVDEGVIEVEDADRRSGRHDTSRQEPGVLRSPDHAESRSAWLLSPATRFWSWASKNLPRRYGSGERSTPGSCRRRVVGVTSQPR